VKKKEDNRSETDSAIIADLSRAIEDLVSGRKRPEELEGIIDEAKTLATQWKNPYSAKDSKYRRPLFDNTSGDRTLLLVALVVALKRKVQELAEQKRISTPEDLEELINVYLHDCAQLRKLGEGIESAKGKPKPKRWQPFEETRRKCHRDFRNSIEYQFGGGLVADLRKNTALRGFSDAALLWIGATCLDNIFRGDAVGKVTTWVNFLGGPLVVVDARTDMQRLEDLFFGIGRKRLAKLLSGKKKRRYWRDVLQIMGKLLKERRRKKPKKSKPGPQRQIWLNDKDLRERVLKGIEVRLVSLSVEDPIKSEFLKVMHSSPAKRIGTR
jgi:hypothetical protein